MATRAVIHTNPRLAHQVQFGEWLRRGFARHGVVAEVSADVDREADLHVVQGPWYARDRWLGHPRTVLLERGWWGDPARDVSLGWMTADGGLSIRAGCADDRFKPVLAPWKPPRDFEARALLLLDYGQSPDPAVVQALTAVPNPALLTVRQHPNSCAPSESLSAAFQRCDFALGHRTSALVSACIAGLPVVCFDHRNPVWPMASNNLRSLMRVQREGWLRDLSYHQWHADEIANGQAWAFLMESF